MSSSAFREVTEWGTGHQGSPEIANLYTKLQPQCLAWQKYTRKASCPKYRAQALRADGRRLGRRKVSRVILEEG